MENKSVYMSNTNWTDTPPNTPGWYWVRRKKECSVEYFPYYGQYPEHWSVIRQNTLDMLIESGNQQLTDEFANLDQKTFVVEYNGPIFPPN